MKRKRTERKSIRKMKRKNRNRRTKQMKRRIWRAKRVQKRENDATKKIIRIKKI